MNQNLIEGLKELVRKVLLAIVPLIIVQLQQLQSVSTEWKYIILVGLVALLSGVDEWLSQKGLGINQKGLTGF